MEYNVCNRIHFSVGAEILRRDLKRDAEPLQPPHLLGEEVGLSDEPVGPGNVLPELRQASFEGFIPKEEKSRL